MIWREKVRRLTSRAAVVILRNAERAANDPVRDVSERIARCREKYKQWLKQRGGGQS